MLRTRKIPQFFTAPEVAAFGSGRSWRRFRRCLCKPACPGCGAGAWSASPSQGATEKPGAAALAVFLLLFLCFFFFVFQSRTTARRFPAGRPWARGAIGRLKAGEKMVEESMGKLLCNQESCPGQASGCAYDSGVDGEAADGSGARHRTRVCQGIRALERGLFRAMSG